MKEIPRHHRSSISKVESTVHVFENFIQGLELFFKPFVFVVVVFVDINFNDLIWSLKLSTVTDFRLLVALITQHKNIPLTAVSK